MVNVSMQDDHFFFRDILGDIVINRNRNRRREIALRDIWRNRRVKTLHIVPVNPHAAARRGRADGVPIGRFMQDITRMKLGVHIAVNFHEHGFHIGRHFDAHGFEGALIKRIGMRDPFAH